jgi:AcrR family transcriptional regulator
MTSEEFPISGYGRRRLLDTAEQLFDENGIDGTSARAIALASGHRNVAAVNYHFGNREQLVRSVLTRRAEALNAARDVLFDKLETEGEVHPRGVVEAIVFPPADLLDDLPGRRYLRLMNQATNHPAYHAEAVFNSVSSLERARTHLDMLLEHLPVPQRLRRAHTVMGLVVYALAEQARLIDRPDPQRPLLDTVTFAQDLVDCALAAALA